MRREVLEEERARNPRNCTITDHQLAKEARVRIRGLLFKCERQTCSCKDHHPVTGMEVITFDHPAGYNLPGYGQPQWVVIRCPKCNYEWSFWKLRGPDLMSLERSASGILDLDLLTAPVEGGAGS